MGLQGNVGMACLSLMLLGAKCGGLSLLDTLAAEPGVTALAGGPLLLRGLIPIGALLAAELAAPKASCCMCFGQSHELPDVSVASD